jgi:hypothetical protein
VPVEEPSTASKADIRTAAKARLLDHLVGEAKQRQRHGNPKRLGGLEVRSGGSL